MYKGQHVTCKRVCVGGARKRAPGWMDGVDFVADSLRWKWTDLLFSMDGRVGEIHQIMYTINS